MTLTSPRSRSRATGPVGLLIGILVAGLLTSCSSASEMVTPEAIGATATPDREAGRKAEKRAGKGTQKARSKDGRGAGARQKRPNIVLVLMDDFSMDLVRTLRSAKKMKRRGASYRHSYVVNSLCCVSRASLLTGQYPHQTGVLTNTANTPNQVGPIGGHEAYAAYGNAGRSVNVRLRRSGYTTGYIGKFLNQYEYNPGRPIPAAPPGWSDWRVLFGSAYDGWDFHSSYVEGGRVKVRHHPAPPAGASAQTKDAAYAGTAIHRM
ncbi:sulfatase-like hydrolase/transferase, partial [Nocardioides sp.]|uniref:sulfatase-like hydrolase/transferase n=1 Tax=Nocardioides sp. TaxID=35761 RepID=UPI0027326BA3